ncbi:MAG TPA: hypothetical protein VHT29_01935 [Solirubrobacteraceae bacterium]|nr:hypothetical protein [Solirubrobacteraceae bacterium]
MSTPVEVLLLSGRLREGSTNAAALRTAAAVAPPGISTGAYHGMGSLPHFNPDEDREGEPVHPAVAAMRAAVRSPLLARERRSPERSWRLLSPRV